MNDLNKNNPFKTPENYFEKLSGTLKERLSEEELKLPEKDGFALPDGYFEDLPAAIKQKLNTEQTKVVQLYAYKKYYWAAAAVAAVFLLTLGLNWNADQEASWDDIAITDIDTYFENNDFGLTAYELGEEIPVDELVLSDFLNTQLDDEHIVNYLDENIDDFEDLNLEDEE